MMLGCTIVHQLDLDDKLIAHSEEEYIDLAVQLASDFSALESLRQSIRHRFLSSTFCDAPRFTLNLEKALRDMWSRYVEYAHDHPEVVICPTVC